MNESNKPVTTITKPPTPTPSQFPALPPAAAPRLKSVETKAQTPQTQAGPRKVLFELSIADASMVSVAGTFNDWKPGATPLTFMGGTKWARKLALAPGRHEYRFVVNGKWMDPPHAKASKLRKLSSGPARVKLMLKNNRTVYDVSLGEAGEIVKAGGKFVFGDQDLRFRPADIVDVSEY